MTTACPCFGRNENCRLCGGSGLVSSDVEAKVARSQHSVQTFHYSGQSDDQKAMGAASTLADLAAKRRHDIAKKSAAEKVAEAEAAERRRLTSAMQAAKRLEAAALEARTPAGKLALKLKAEQVARLAEERAAKDAEQATKSIAYWNKLWGKSR